MRENVLNCYLAKARGMIVVKKDAEVRDEGPMRKSLLGDEKLLCGPSMLPLSSQRGRTVTYSNQVTVSPSVIRKAVGPDQCTQAHQCVL